MIPDTKPLPEPIVLYQSIPSEKNFGDIWIKLQWLANNEVLFENVSNQVFLSLLMIWNVFWWLKYITQNGQWDFMALWELKNSFHKSKIIFFYFLSFVISLVQNWILPAKILATNCGDHLCKGYQN